MLKSHHLLAGATILFALAFNGPYAALAAIYDYPQILRQPAGEALTAFAAGGTSLIVVWYDFMLCALALIPLAIALAIRPKRLSAWPALAIFAAICGALAGLTQAIGLARWAFVVPDLARTYTDPGASGADRDAAVRLFEMLNLYGGVAIGEHLGQLLTALFVAAIGLMQAREGARICAGVAGVTAATMIGGTGEGFALAIGADGSVFSLLTIAAFLGLTLWLIATGLNLAKAGGGVQAGV